MPSKRPASPIDVRDLRQALKGERDSAKKKRLKAVLLMLEGKRTAAKVAAELKISRASIYLYLERFNRGGVRALLAHLHAGRPKAMMPPNVREFLVTHIEESKIIKGRMRHCGRYLRLRMSIVGRADLPVWRINRWLRTLKVEMRVPLKLKRWKFPSELYTKRMDQAALDSMRA